MTRYAIGLALVLIGLSRCAARADDAVLLARVCLSEADASRSNDCAAIAEVTRRRASMTGRTVGQQLRAYSGEATGTRPTVRPRLVWISRLDRGATRPQGYPERLRWEPYRAVWLRLLAEAEALLAHPRSVCREPPDHWGMRTGHEYWSRVRIGWRPIDCGPTRNAFWRVR